MKRTTITLPTDLVETLQETLRAKNKTQAVIMAIEDEIRRKKLERIKGMAGKMEFDLEADAIRHGDHRLG